MFYKIHLTEKNKEKETKSTEDASTNNSKEEKTRDAEFNEKDNKKYKNLNKKQQI